MHGISLFCLNGVALASGNLIALLASLVVTIAALIPRLRALQMRSNS